MSELVKIYVLKDPNDKQLIRYCGKTQATLHKRLNQHKYAWKNINKLSHVNNWIKSLSRKGLFPIIELVAAASRYFNIDSHTIRNKLENKVNNDRRTKLKEYDFVKL